ncbi:MAG: glycosyltransferase family 2 protein [Chloroflexi bacterium]|nr:glycosyltransferase family 2 protein [Ardenticatenaceae bacterium]NOG35049.1 glycosyltransferase family 2 protein [Chloroflexota bacterium]
MIDLPPDTSSVYIIVLTWNNWEDTVVCLQSLQRLTYPIYQVVVVDNGSTDGTVTHIEHAYPEVHLIQNGRNLGFAAAANVGMRYAMMQRASYVLLLNNDAIAPPTLLDELIGYVTTLPDVGMATPPLSYRDASQTLWFAGSKRHWLTMESVDFGPIGPKRHSQADVCHPVDYIFGTAMLIPTSVLQRVGLFDEKLYLYYEDMDLSLRIQAAGYKLYYIPMTSVQHGVSGSTRSLSSMRHYHKARSSVIFFRKHTGWGRRLVIVPYRLASALRTVTRLGWASEWAAARAYLSGLKDGLRIEI